MKRLAFALLTLNAVLFLWVRAVWTTAPFELDTSEGILLWETARLDSLDSAYPPIDRAPHGYFAYPPLYPWLARVAGPFAGGPLVAGRWISLLSLVGIALCIRRWYAALAVFTLASVQLWAPSMRVDLFGLLLTIGGLMTFERRKDVLAAALFVAALYTRQGYLAAPAAALLCTWRTDRERALRFAALCAAFGLPPLVWLQLGSHGGFWLNVVTYVRGGFTLDTLVRLYSANLIAMLPLLAAAWLGWRKADPLWRVWTMLAAAMALTCGKEGADVNYFLEWNAGACILAGFAASAPWKNWRAALLLLPVLASAPAMIEAADLALTNGGRTGMWQARAAAHREVIRRIAESPDPVFSDNILAILQAGKTPLIEPTTTAFLGKTGLWDPKRLARMFERGEFSLAAVRDLRDPEARRALTVRYVENGSAGPFRFHVPRPASPPGRD